MASKEMALASTTQVEELADSLSQLADELHARVMRAIHQRGGATQGDLSITLAQAQTLYENEVTLRQRANRLYVNAASFAGADLLLPQHNLLAVTEAAALKIRQINVLKELTDLSTDLLALATAAVAGKPQQIINVAEKIRGDFDSLRRQALAAPATQP